MKKFILSLALACLLVASQAFAQPAEVPQLRPIAAQSQSLLQTNTASTCYEFTRRVLAAINDPHWGHVGKTSGEGQFPLAGLGVRKGRDGNSYNVSGVSHDAIYFCANPDGRGGCNYGSGDWQVDLLGNGNDGVDPLGTPAIPQWNVIPQQFYRPGNPWIGVVTNPSPTPAPAPVPSPVVDLSGVLERIDAIKATLGTIVSQLNDIRNAQSESASNVASLAARVESVLTSNDRIVRQLLSPPTYSGRVVGLNLTLKPTVVPVKP